MPPFSGSVLVHTFYQIAMQILLITTGYRFTVVVGSTNSCGINKNTSLPRVQGNGNAEILVYYLSKKGTKLGRHGLFGFCNVRNGVQMELLVVEKEDASSQVHILSRGFIMCVEILQLFGTLL